MLIDRGPQSEAAEGKVGVVTRRVGMECPLPSLSERELELGSEEESKAAVELSSSLS
jgi:hypothetical protein